VRVRMEWMRRLWLLGGVVLVMLAAGCANVDELKRQNADLQARLAAVEAERDSLQDQSSVLEAESRSLNERLSQAQASASELEELRRKLGGDVELTLRGGLVTMELPDKVLYRSGEAKLTEAGKATLRRVASALNSEFAGQSLRVEGHTDTDPIRRTRQLYKSNWELSSARALEVVHFLTEQCGVAPQRLHAAAFSQYRPVAPNSTTAGKQQNRRVAIVILPGEKK